MSASDTHAFYGGHVEEQGRRLRAAREKTGVNITGAALLVGMTKQRLAAIEQGRIEAKARDVALIARLTGADIVDLLMGDERDPIGVPNEPAFYRKPNGQDARERNREERSRRQPKRAPRRPGPEPAPATVSTRPAWRPTNIGRDLRPVAEREQESTDAPT